MWQCNACLWTSLHDRLGFGVAGKLISVLRTAMWSYGIKELGVIWGWKMPGQSLNLTVYRNVALDVFVSLMREVYLLETFTR